MNIQTTNISEINNSTKNTFLSILGLPNIYLFEFSGLTMTNSLSLQLEISRTIVDNSLLYVYYNMSVENSTMWTPIYGFNNTGTYMFRSYIWNSSPPNIYTYVIRSHNWNGTLNNTSKTFSRFRIYFVNYK